jgi:hypothetical protein
MPATPCGLRARDLVYDCIHGCQQCRSETSGSWHASAIGASKRCFHVSTVPWVCAACTLAMPTAATPTVRSPHRGLGGAVCSHAAQPAHAPCCGAWVWNIFRVLWGRTRFTNLGLIFTPPTALRSIEREFPVFIERGLRPCPFGPSTPQVHSSSSTDLGRCNAYLRIVQLFTRWKVFFLGAFSQSLSTPNSDSAMCYYCLDSIVRGAWFSILGVLFGTHSPRTQ